MLLNKRPKSAGSHEPSADRHLPAYFFPAEQLLAAFRPQRSSPTQSVIDAWLTITGNLHSEGDVTVDGRICGDIRCARLVVSRNATVIGDIVAEEAVVRGAVKGSIRANRVVLQETACVESRIHHKVLSIDEGATFDGQSCRIQDPLTARWHRERSIRPVGALPADCVPL